MENENKSFLNVLIGWCVWLGVIMSVSGSLIRSFNIGHQTESYILSTLAHVPFLFSTSTWADFVYNVGHLSIDLIGICSYCGYGMTSGFSLAFLSASGCLLCCMMWMKQFTAVKTQNKKM
jgi:hypothetical protein